MRGTVRKLRSFRKDRDPDFQFAQQWVVDGEDGEQYLLSVKEGQQIVFLTEPKEPGRIQSVDVNLEGDDDNAEEA